MEFSHSSLSDTRAYLSNVLAEKANGVDVYAITGERSQFARSLLRLPQMQRSVLQQEINKIDRMKLRYEQRMKKVANSFLCSQTNKAVQWQHADIHWAASTATKMPCYRNNSFYQNDSEAAEERKKRRASDAVLYRSADYSNFGDRTYYRLMRGNSDLTKPPPIAGLSSGPRLEFLRLGGHTCFNKVTHTTTKDVVSNYSDSLRNRNKLLSRSSLSSR